MPIIVEAEAVGAARAYADGRGYASWREGSVQAVRLIVAGRDCWRVTADDAPRPGASWLDDEVDGSQSYLVDANTGECIGIGLLNGYSLFGTSR